MTFDLQDRAQYRTGIIYAALTSLSWSIIPIFLKPACNELSSTNVAGARVLIGFLGLLLISGLRSGWTQRVKIIWKWAALCGVLFAYHYWSYTQGVALSGPALGRVLISLGSVFLALMGVFLFKERLSVLQLFGILLAFGGVGAFTFSLHAGHIDTVPTDAVLILLSSSIVWAAYAGIQRMASRKGAGSEFLMIMFFVASLVLLCLSSPNQFLESSALGLWSSLILGLLTVSGYFCFSKALGKLPASHLSTVTCLSPVITLCILISLYTLLPDFLAPEAINVFSFGFASLGVLGLYLVILRKTPKFAKQS